MALPEAVATLLLSLARGAEIALLGYGLVFVRAGAIMALLPGFGEQFIPMRLKVAITLCLTIAAAPMVRDVLPPVSFAPLPLLRLIAAEALAGLMIGAVLRLLIMVLQLAGTIAAQSASVTQVAGVGVTPDPMPAIGNLLTIGGMTLAVISGLHVKVVAALAQSYRVLPPAGTPAGADLAKWGVAHAAEAFALAFSLAAPFVLASLVYNLCLGVINRAMPS